jgi:hypothetical protein
MPFIREMSREKIRKKEKYSPKKSSGGGTGSGKRGGMGSWTPVPSELENWDVSVRFLTMMLNLL